MVAADELDGPLGDLESHLRTQLMKAVVTISASNDTKWAKGRGGDTDGN